MATVGTLIEELETVLDYEETGSLSKAKTVISLVNKLILKRPQSSARDGSSIAYDMNQLENMRNDARIYIQASNRGRSARFLGPSQGFRG